MNQIDVKNITDFIFKLIFIFSDIDYQKRVWVQGQDSEVSCFADDTDDFVQYFELIMEDPSKYHYSPNQYEMLYRLYKKIDDYNGPDNPSELIRDPEWLEIVEFAKKVYAMLKK